MNVKEAITNRMSIRSFTKGEVSNEMILEILRAGNCAPTAGNIQPWEFIIVREHLTKKEIVNTTFLGKMNKRYSSEMDAFSTDFYSNMRRC